MREALNLCLQKHASESKQILMHPIIIGSIEDIAFISIIHLFKNYW